MVLRSQGRAGRIARSVRENEDCLREPGLPHDMMSSCYLLMRLGTGRAHQTRINSNGYSVEVRGSSTRVSSFARSIHELAMLYEHVFASCVAALNAVMNLNYASEH